jgi:uncharacterized protein with GYD domain
MATYIMLNKFTPQGSQSIKDIPKRIEENRARFVKLGAELKSWHLTMGAYDAVVIMEAPNDEVMAKIAMAICGQGNAQTQTMRAFTLEEFKALTSQLP